MPKMRYLKKDMNCYKVPYSCFLFLNCYYKLFQVYGLIYLSRYLDQKTQSNLFSLRVKKLDYLCRC